MGACFVTETFDGNLSPSELEKQYDSRVAELLSTYGSDPYNGTFTTLTGLKIERLVFETQADASDYLHKRCTKWGNAVAVRYKDRRDTVVVAPTFEGEQRVAGTMGLSLRCAPMRRRPSPDDCPVVFADQLTLAQQNRLRRAYMDWHTKQETTYSAGHEFHAALDVIRYNFPITSEMTRRVKTVGNRYHKLFAASKKAEQKLAELDKKLAAKLYVNETVDHGEQWLVGGVCAE
jgi:hypothetical protein